MRFCSQLILVVFLIAISCRTTAPLAQDSFKPGACYQKAVIPSTAKINFTRVAIYQGAEQDCLNQLRDSSILVQEAGTEWIKKRTDKSCVSADPDDCLVWCLVTVEPRHQLVSNIIKDTAACPEYEIEEIAVRKTSSTDKSRQKVEYREVLCESQLSQKVLADIQWRLNDLGYLRGQWEEGKFKDKSGEALRMYQWDYGLPVGSFNLETMEHLGVNY